MFHYITHPIEALLEMRECCAWAGRSCSRIGATIAWRAGSATCTCASRTAPSLGLTSRPSASTFSARAGFGNIQVERYKISWLWGLMTAVVSVD